MVNLVEDWESIEEYAGDKQGFYQVLQGGIGVEIRVTVGKLGYKQSFDNSKDPVLERIIKFCGFQSYVKISENIRDEQFFK
ncbi:MAG: hypothetical protein CW691_03615 [Candidatus Bathyarchaeum sp.]|nr:MAG: hypothetical protein CW691_03615 [Candidatus Bathyarchaeum sp.]